MKVNRKKKGREIIRRRERGREGVRKRSKGCGENVSSLSRMSELHMKILLISKESSIGVKEDGKDN